MSERLTVKSEIKYGTMLKKCMINETESYTCRSICNEAVKHKPSCDGCHIAEAFDRLAELEDKIESGELVEVVRCKECKHHKYCGQEFWNDFDGDGFCSKGAKMDGGRHEAQKP